MAGFSTKSIVYALVANFGIAIIKTVAAVITGSGSMLAEAIHSYADCGNQALLFVGLRRAKIAPSPKHPLGHGKEIYFWSFIVALILFSVGGLFSIYEGFNKLQGEVTVITNPYLAIGVLVAAVFLETASLVGCLREINKIRRNLSLRAWISDTRKSELLVVLGEDIAALLGLILALVAIILTILTGNHIYDAIGSIGIGVLLVIVSIFLGSKIKGFLIGKSVGPDGEKEIKDFLEKLPEIETLLNLITFQLGEHIMVAIKAKMKKTPTNRELIDNINSCERALKENFSDVKWIFFEPDIEDITD